MHSTNIYIIYKSITAGDNIIIMIMNTRRLDDVELYLYIANIQLEK